MSQPPQKIAIFQCQLVERREVRFDSICVTVSSNRYGILPDLPLRRCYRRKFTDVLRCVRALLLLAPAKRALRGMDTSTTEHLAMYSTFAALLSTLHLSIALYLTPLCLTVIDPDSSSFAAFDSRYFAISLALGRSFAS